MKKILSVILTILTCTTIVGCDGNGVTPEVETPEVETPEVETPEVENPGVNESSCEYILYTYAKVTGYSNTYENWCSELANQTVVFRTVDDNIEWKYSTISTWNNLYESDDSNPTWYNEFLTGDVVSYSIYYTVSFDTLDGSVIETQIILSGECATYEVPTKEGYTFDSWVSNNAPFDFTQPINEKTTLTAKWNVTTEIYDEHNNLYSIISETEVALVSGSDQHAIINIPSSVNGYKVVSIEYSAFYRYTELTSVTIPEGITSIGYAAFNGCSSLTNITIPSSVTSIGSSAFDYCTSLTNINIDESNSTFSSENGALYYNESTLVCWPSASGNITITNNVTSIGNYAFAGCSELASVEIPNSVTSIGMAVFYNCTGLTSIEIPSGVTKILSMTFSGCSSLTSITIPSSVTSIEREAFYNCTGLTSIEIPSSVTSIGNRAFMFCNGLTSVEIHEGLTSIEEQTFSGCSGLTSITVPNSVTSIGVQAFDGCSGLTNIELLEGLTSIANYAFFGCTGLTNITIPSTITSIGSSVFFLCNSISIYFDLTEEEVNKQISFGDNWSISVVSIVYKSL